jgi:hypothetical protein
MPYAIVPNRPLALLQSMMVALQGEAQISFEGNFQDPEFWESFEAVPEQTSILGRQTIVPQLDFVILPLDHKTVARLTAYLQQNSSSLADAIIHIQIGNDSEVMFGAYDNFHEECVFASDSFPRGLLEQLAATDDIKSFKHWSRAQ